jgi:hypothetical protein
MLENTLFDLRAAALARIGKAGVLSTVDPFATVRFLANLRPESTEAIFSTSKHPSEAKDLKAFDAAIGDTGGSCGFGTTTTLTPKHTSLRQKRKPNDNGRSVVQGILLVARGVKKPKTTTNANTLTDDSDDAQYLAADAVGFVRDHVAKAIAEDYMPYVQKSGGQKEYLGPIRWEATESGILFALYSYPEGWKWGGVQGQGTEMIVGFERTHLTYNAEWVADTDRPWEDVADGLSLTFDAAQPGADEVYCNFDVAVAMIGAHAAAFTG